MLKAMRDNKLAEESKQSHVPEEQGAVPEGETQATESKPRISVIPVIESSSLLQPMTQGDDLTRQKSADQDTLQRNMAPAHEEESTGDVNNLDMAHHDISSQFSEEIS